MKMQAHITSQQEAFMSQAFDKIVKKTISLEGGYSNHPGDPGGPTKYGISLRSFPELGPDGIRNLTKAKARALYESHYWLPVHGDQVAAVSERLAMALFDFGVHSGTRRSVRFLQTSANYFNTRKIKADGFMGPKTMAAIKSTDHESLLSHFLAERMVFCSRLSNWEENRRGWSRRILNIGVKGCA